MISDWFNATFAKTCFEFNLEPAYDEKNDVLYVFGADIPDHDIQSKIIALVPKNQKVQFLSSLMVGTKSVLSLLIQMSGGRNLIIRSNPNHEVVLEVESSSSIVSDPNSPLWIEVTRILKNDPFTGTIKYVINGESYEPIPTEDNPPFESIEEDFKEEERSMRRRPLPKSKPVPGKVNDGRFDYDRDYLPEDVDKDVKILLETSDSVEDFLNKI